MTAAVTGPRIAVAGATGRMGRAVAAVAAELGVALAGGIARTARGGEEAAALGYPRVVAPAGAGKVLEGADALIDFSSPELLRRLLREEGGTLSGKALAIGTTGLGEEDEALLAEAAGSAPVLVAANFSLGIELLAELVERAAAALGEEYDVEVVEAHHREKADAPSGTALRLGEAVAAARGVSLDDLRRDGRSGRVGPRPSGEVGFHAVRGGGVVGEHRVLWLGTRERIEISHLAGDRALFAEGAVRAALWLAERPPGRYGMRDLLGGTGG